MNWNEILEYNSKTGNLHWKYSMGSMKWGNVAGSFTSEGYVRFVYKRRYYNSHRVIWEIHHGAIPKTLNIDHVDGNRSNNRLENLRLVNQSQNSKNAKRYCTNTSGVTGVCYEKNRGKWIANARQMGKYVNLGRFAKKSDAIKARKKAEKELGYHPNHGRH